MAFQAIGQNADHGEVRWWLLRIRFNGYKAGEVGGVDLKVAGVPKVNKNREYGRAREFDWQDESLQLTHHACRSSR